MGPCFVGISFGVGALLGRRFSLCEGLRGLWALWYVEGAGRGFGKFVLRVPCFGFIEDPRVGMVVSCYT